MDDGRHYNNGFEVYRPGMESKYYDAMGKCTNQWRNCLMENIYGNVNRLKTGISATDNSHNVTVYSGSTGIALMYIHLALNLQDGNSDEYLRLANSIIRRALGSIRGRRQISFLCGDAGILAVAAILYSRSGSDSEAMECIEILERLSYNCDGKKLPDELLYGRIGYVYTLKLIEHSYKRDEESNIDKVIKLIIDSGVNYSKAHHSPSPLMYSFHEKEYIGAAHGLSGILYLLLRCRDKSKAVQENLTLIKNSADYILSCQLPGGNFPSSLGNNRDRLIHWCHGAPGVLFMLCECYKAYGDEEYLNAAKACADVIWARGLLHKGYGLCHGVAGNGYSLLHMYIVTKEPSYLYKTCKFAEWCMNSRGPLNRVADRPMSLMEGLSGTIYFLADLLNISKAAFPAFQLPEEC